MRYEMRVMLAQGHGSIINLSSTLGSRGAAGASMYVASKHAVEGLTKVAALEGAAGRGRGNAGRPGPRRDRDAQPLYGQCRPESRPRRRRAGETCWTPGRDR